MYFSQVQIDKARRARSADAGIDAQTRLVELGSTIILGSFRTVAVNYLWYRAQVLKDRREWVELEGVINLIAKVQPTDVDAYDNQAYNMAYNIQHDAQTPVEAWRWIERAVAFGEKGIERNKHHPKVWRLQYTLAWIFHYRCSNLPGGRTEYFAEQIKKKYGKEPLLVAADYYEKAVLLARQPNAKGANPNILSMWPFVYEEIAKRAEEAGNYDEMVKYRLIGMETQQKLAKIFPEYQKQADDYCTRFQEFLDLHKTGKEAEAAKKAGDTDKYLAMTISLVDGWNALLKKRPENPEAQRNALEKANLLAQLSAEITDPAQKELVDLKILTLRYNAAEPRYATSAAVDGLIKAIAPFDARLEKADAEGKLLDEAKIVNLSARAWTRIMQSSRKDKALAKKAEAALIRRDFLVATLDAKTRPAAEADLLQQWLALISSSGIDSQAGKKRIVETATTIQKQLIPGLQAIAAGMQNLKNNQNLTQLERNQQVADLALAAYQANQLVRVTADCWFALMQKSKAYAEESALAEKEIAQLANALESAGEAAIDLLGLPSENIDTQDPRLFIYNAKQLWSILHQFNPRNTLPLQKVSEIDKKLTSNPGKQVHVHRDGCGHDH